MKHVWKRILTAVLALALILPVLPAELMGASARAEAAYGKVTAEEVRLRRQPSMSADYWFKMDKGFISEIINVSTSKGETWYKLEAKHNNRTYIGYVIDDYFAPLTAEETAAYLNGGTVTGGAAEEDKDPEASDTGSSAAPGATGKVTTDEVNFRKTEGGELIVKLNRDTVVEILTIPTVIDANHWYKVRYNGQEGYIQAPYLQVVSNGSEEQKPGSSASGYGFVQLVINSANLRLKPNGTIDAHWRTPGEVLAVTGEPQTVNGGIWYPISFNGKAYFIHEECVKFLPGSEGGSGTTQPTPAPETVLCYVKTTEANVNLRLKPGGETIEQIKKGTILPLVAAPVKPSNSQYTWYYVKKGNIHGYLRGDCVQTCDADGNKVTGPTPVPDSSEANPPSSGTVSYVKTTKKGVNLRTKPAGSSTEQIAKGVVLPVIGKVITSGLYDWYPVRAESGRTGYVRSDCVTPTSSSGGSADQKPDTDPPASSYGYIKVTKAKVNLRQTMGGEQIAVLEKNTVWPMTGSISEKIGKYSWYPVNVNGRKGYVRDDCAFKLSPEQEESYLAGNGVPGGSATVKPPVENTVAYVQTTMAAVNLRVSPSKDAEARFNVNEGTVLAYNLSSNVGGSTWYRVVYQNQEVWVLGSCVKVMTEKEYNDYLASKPAVTPQPEVIVGYVKTTEAGVNLRSEPAGSNILGRVDKGVVLSYSREPESVRGYNWYYVKTSKGYGYLRGDCVVECDDKGNAVESKPTTPPDSSTGGQEATYKTLRRGSQGTAVKEMVAELKKQGYFTGTVTSTFTSAVEAAVKAFQKDKNLVVDGIAGPNTLHKLFGTVPPGMGGGNLDFTFYPAEKIDWYKGGIQTLWAKGANYKVYDVKTGIVWWAHRWSGANHADVETLTAADTARFCRMYGVSSADKINDTDHWFRRPSLVTIGNRTFACSLYGVPHNPKGDTIANNNMTGQVCIHFTNSMTHETGVVDSNHQEAIQYAWEHAPNGHK